MAERRLEKVARSMLGTLPLHADSMLAFREFHAPNGVPDITIVAPDPRGSARLSLNVDPLLNSLDAGIVSATTAHIGKDVDEIALRLGWRTTSVSRRLPGLLRRGALIDAGGGRYVRPESLTSMGRLYAVELKIDDWGRALRQCRNYRLWSSGYLLVLERVPERSIDHLRREVTRDRGGLVVGGEMLVRPRLSRQSAAVRLWSSEHVLAELRVKSNLRRLRRR